MLEKVNTKVNFLFFYAKSPKYYYYYLNNGKTSYAIEYIDTYKFIGNYISDRNILEKVRKKLSVHEHFLLDIQNQICYDLETEKIDEFLKNEMIPSVIKAEKTLIEQNRESSKTFTEMNASEFNKLFGG